LEKKISRTGATPPKFFSSENILRALVSDFCRIKKAQSPLQKMQVVSLRITIFSRRAHL
jgi:hypothetical protein